jgi:hypothetical protein
MEAQAQEYVQRRLLNSLDPKSSRSTMLRNMINTGRVRINTPMTTPAWAQLVKAGAKAKGVQVRKEGGSVAESSAAVACRGIVLD